MTRGIFLVGFSGTGKSTIAALIGAALQWPVYDLDAMIVETSGSTIPAIFAREGEAGFRARETDALRAVAANVPFVVATGAGAVVRAENRRIMAQHGWLIALEGRPETLHSRIQRQLQQAAPDAVRPLLNAASPLEQMRALKHSRQHVYALADWTVHTDRLTPEQAAAEVVRAMQMLAATVEPPAEHAAEPAFIAPATVLVAAGPWPYQAVIGWRHTGALGERVRHLLPVAQQVAVLAGESAWERAGATIQHALADAGLAVHVRTLPDDQRVKTLATASASADWLLQMGMRRDDLLLTLGGAPIVALGGYVAAMFGRGIPLVHVPASLEAMIGTAIGGAATLNHGGERDLLGVRYHPRLVWIDAALLADGSLRDRHAAWSYPIQRAMLEGSLLPGESPATPLWAILHQHAAALLRNERTAVLPVLARCVAIKAQVSAADEYGTGQLRALLRYGHMVGAALEALMDGALLPGEALAAGMLVATRLALRCGAAPAAVEQEQRALFAQFGLPTSLPAAPHDALLAQIAHAARFGTARWVLPTAIGRATFADVSAAELAAVLAELAAERQDA